MQSGNISCPQCRASARTPAPLAPGTRLRCPRCQFHFTVPQPAAPTEPPSARSRKRLAAGLVGGFLAAGAVAIAVLSRDPGQVPEQPGPPGQAQSGSPEKPGPVLPPPKPPWLSAEEQRRVDGAIERGVKYLKGCLEGTEFSSHLNGASHIGDVTAGSAALAGLALLSCEVPATAPAVRKALSTVRAAEASLVKTYEIGPCIWFLDKLGDPKDRPLIQTLAVRLLVGQDPQGGWPYRCPNVAKEDEQLLLELLQSRVLSPKDIPERLQNLPVLQVNLGRVELKESPQVTTNSLTLFGMLGLWVAQKHGVPVERSLALAERRFRQSQLDDGRWRYQLQENGYTYYDSMTCAGLLALALGRGNTLLHARLAAPDGKPEASPALTNDPAVEKGFRYLGKIIDKAAVRNTPGHAKILKVDAWGDLFFLWAVERVAVVYDLRTIEGKDWYRWGVHLLLPTQNDDGSWREEYHGVIDTCFALLFLKRANVAQNLTDLLYMAPSR